MPFHEPRDLLVEIEFRAIDGKVGSACDTVGEYRFCRPVAILLAFREIDHGLLGSAQVERGASPFHGLSDRFHVGVGIPVEELQE